MNATTKGFFALFMISTILMGGYSFLSVKAQDSEGSLGKDIAATFDSILSAHRTAIDTFITEHKVLMAETQAERLNIIEEKKDELRAKIEEVNATREALIADLQNGTITGEEFGQEMRALVTDLNGFGEIGQELGQMLGDLGKELADELKTRAEELSDDLQAFEGEASSVADEVLDALSFADVPVEEAAEKVPEEVPAERPEVP